MELLKLSELQNFFGDECVQVALEQVNSEQIALVNSTQSVENKTLTEKVASINSKGSTNLDLVANTAVVYSVVLDNQTVMFLRSPNGALSSYLVRIEAKQLQEEIRSLRFTLENVATEEYLTQSQKIYDLLLRPMDADLALVTTDPDW